ncbi:DgyrCDS2572 [Dimorphilus gyrociliatus]|uniref:DgyrCDS2572 n=1 Tax=Dimorphilus gyrociliatus TaxID=2664684 RepID=A0A7I8VCH8_9ANNE|nr:DgyrCDS2572 [Dimorphilus gyrociliatus]
MIISLSFSYRYLERFRTEEPKSREERSKPNEKDFWWLKDNQKSFKTLDDLREERKNLEEELLRQSIESNNPWRDRTFLELQAKADKLIEKSSSLASDNECIALVSTDGLKSHDSSDLSSHLTSVSQKLPNRPQYSQSKIQLDKSDLIAKSNDILAEWRAKRKYQPQQPKPRENIDETDIKSLEDKVADMRKELKSFTFRVSGKQISPSLQRFNRNTSLLLQPPSSSSFCHCSASHVAESKDNTPEVGLTIPADKITTPILQTLSTSCQTNFNKFEVEKEEKGEIADKQEIVLCSTGCQTNGEKKMVDTETDVQLSLEIEENETLTNTPDGQIKERVEDTISHVIEKSIYGLEQEVPERDFVEAVENEEDNLKEEQNGLEFEKVLDSILESDEEEFADDVILAKLREQRQHCLNRWKNYCTLLNSES